jgi:phage repressor protein C with HTH and peptisase S24 domain
MKSKTVLPNKEFFEELIGFLNQGKEVSLMVKGTSMKPFLDEETEVFLKQDKSYKRGDVCLFKYKEQYLLHRLLKSKDGYYYFRGDNSYRKEVVNEAVIFGKVIYYKRNDKDYLPWNIRVRFRLLIHKTFLWIKSVGRKVLRKSK